jgi:hypothetical protein
MGSYALGLIDRYIFTPLQGANMCLIIDILKMHAPMQMSKIHFKKSKLQKNN